MTLISIETSCMVSDNACICRDKSEAGSSSVTCVFFFKQKTAYEMLRSLVGSEMCIRDRCAIAVTIDGGIQIQAR